MTEKEDNEIAERKKHDDSNTSLVKSLIDSFRDAFNNHDPKKLASLLVEDGEWTDVIGTTMVGRLEIRAATYISFSISIERSITQCYIL